MKWQNIKKMLLALCLTLVPKRIALTKPPILLGVWIAINTGIAK